MPNKTGDRKSASIKFEIKNIFDVVTLALQREKKKKQQIFINSAVGIWVVEINSVEMYREMCRCFDLCEFVTLAHKHRMNHLQDSFTADKRFALFIRIWSR